MSLDLSPTKYDYKPTILHEFGHALGLDHEHQLPGAPPQYVHEELVKYLTKYPPSLDPNETLESYIEVNWAAMKADADSVVGQYDPQSIMHYL